MRVSPPALSFRPDLPLRFIAGDPALDFVNTVDWTPRGLVHERLNEYADLLRWGQGAGLLAESAVRRLRSAAGAHVFEADTALAGARHVRWVLQRVFSSLARQRLDTAALATFNDLLCDALRHLALAPARGPARPGFDWSWPQDPPRLELPLWLTTWAAAQLLTSADAARVRVCGGPDCGWLFVDRSRNGLRRWCEMATCGSAEKTRKRRPRRSVNRRP